jgi:predicted GNAT family acetyltransferase
MTDYELINNKATKQYEFHIDGLIPRIMYQKSGDKIFLIHTEVPLELGGKGIANQLVKKVLEDTQKRGLKLVPLCPFVKKYLQRHPEWEFLVIND